MKSYQLSKRFQSDRNLFILIYICLMLYSINMQKNKGGKKYLICRNAAGKKGVASLINVSLLCDISTATDVSYDIKPWKMNFNVRVSTSCKTFAK